MKRLLLTTTLALGLSAPAAQAVIPVIDIKNIAQVVQVISQAKAQLKEMILQNLKLDAQTLKLIEQLRTLQATYQALTKGLSLQALGIDPKTFLSDVLPGWGDLQTALIAAQTGNWGAVLTSGAVGGTATATVVDRFFASAGLSQATVQGLTQSTVPATARIGTAANTGAFLSVTAAATSRAAEMSLQRLDGFAKAIPTTTNLKEATDLNTAVTIELGIALANIWAVEGVAIAGIGQAGVMDAATAAEEEKFLKVGP